MKILFVLEYYYPHTGGVEKLFRNLAESLVKKGFDIKVVTTLHDKSLKKEEVLNGVRIIRLNLRNRFLFTFFSLPTLIRETKGVDIIHTTSYNAALPAWLVAKLKRKKIVITFHEVWGKLWFKLPFINALEKTVFWLFEKLILKLHYNKIVAVSDFTKESLIDAGIREDKLIRIYNGMKYPEQEINSEFESKNFTFTYLGRIGISKGIELLIPAAHRFISKNPKSYFKFISPKTPDKLYKKILKQIKAHDLGNNIRLLHNLSEGEIQKELLSSHCIIIPSHSEGFCFVAAEASALKVPIISSGMGALEEVVSGEVINIKKMKEKSMYKALVKAKNSNFTYIPRKKFLVEDCISAYENLYTEVLKQ